MNLRRHEPTWNIEKVVKSVDRNVRAYNRKDFKSVGLLLVTVVLFLLYMFMDDGVVDPGASGTEGDETSMRRPMHDDVLLPEPTKPAPARKAASVYLRGGDDVAEENKYRERQKQVVAEFMHAFEGYKRVAWGHDEVRPESNITNDSWGGFAVTLIDSLDTMMLMGLTGPLKLTRAWIAENLHFDKDWDASFFEFSIRYLGGLLAAYELSDDPMYLEKARDIGDRLLPAFTSPTGLPFPVVNLHSGKARTPSWNTGRAVLAEFGSVQLEFKQLAYHTKNRTYYDKAEHVMELIRKIPRDRYIIGGQDTYPLLPVFMDIDTATQPQGHISLGAMADSYYEYLLKQWLQSGKRDTRYRVMYDEFVDRVQKLLVQETVPSGWTIVGEFHGHVVPQMDHLVCFFPGLLALGAEGPNEKSHLDLAKKLMETCWKMYASMPTGLAPEVVTFNTKSPGSSSHPDFNVQDPKYLLRPETIESLFWLWRKTGDAQYREKGWKIFEAIRKHCRTGTAYSGIKDVQQEKPELNDSMQSFALAETFKYLFLLFANKGDAHTEDVLQKTVFTTEAHPLRMFDVVSEFGTAHTPLAAAT